MVLPIIAALGVALGWLWAGIQAVSAAAISIASTIFNFGKDMFIHFNSIAPSWVKMLMVLFFVLFLGNTVVGFFVGVQYACLTTEELRSPESSIDAITLYFSGALSNVNESSLDYDTYVLERTIPTAQYNTSSAESIFGVRCFDTNPRLTFFGINFLNYQFWVIMILLGVMFQVYRDYAQ